MNNEFLRQYKRISKSCQGQLDQKGDELREILARLMNRFPAGMAREGAEFFLKGEAWDGEVQKGADLIDLHNEELNGESCTFDREDWVFIKELVNSYADDLDMDWLTYSMQFFLDMGII